MTRRCWRCALRQQRNFLATLLVSQGTPMLLGGDELGRTQRGNNNAWCQDNELSWYDWENADDSLREFTKRLIALRRNHPVFRRESFLIGSDEGEGSNLPDAWWFRSDGRKMTKSDWDDGEPVLGLFLNGDAIPNPGPHGEQIRDDSFLVLFNAHSEERTITLPRPHFGAQWALEVSTADPRAGARQPSHYGAREQVPLPDRSVDRPAAARRRALICAERG